MSTADLINTCPVCGAEESLDALLMRMIDDDQVRRLIADVLTRSLPLGGMVVSYLRLHKPAKQRLRMSKVQALLAELVPDIVRGAVNRKGRDWQADGTIWRAAFQAVMDARDKGTLTLPLEGNAYLYEVVLRLVDQAEGERERQTERDRRARAHQGGVAPIGDLVEPRVDERTPAPAATPTLAPPAPPTQPSRMAQRMKAEAEKRLNRKTNDPTTEAP